MKKAEATRQHILQKAFELIYQKGYQTTSIDDILATTGLTKGAFYYHFQNKDVMGLAIINEVLKPSLNNSFIAPLQNATDPLDAIYHMMHHLLMKDEFMRVEFGCPAANLTHEMTPWNADFANALTELIADWETLLASVIEKGKKAGLVRKDVRGRQVALFVMSGYWGIRNFGKLSGSRKTYTPFLKELKLYLDSLR